MMKVRQTRQHADCVLSLEDHRMSLIIVFDVNETLLDLTALDAHFERVFRAAGVREEWFKQVVQSALLTSILDAYSDFGAVGAAALEMTAAAHDVFLTEDNRNAILGTMRKLPPHPEVPDSLRRLREQGLRATPPSPRGGAT